MRPFVTAQEARTAAEQIAVFANRAQEVGDREMCQRWRRVIKSLHECERHLEAGRPCMALEWQAKARALLTGGGEHGHV